VQQRVTVSPHSLLSPLPSCRVPCAAGVGLASVASIAAARSEQRSAARSAARGTELLRCLSQPPACTTLCVYALVCDLHQWQAVNWSWSWQEIGGSSNWKGMAGGRAEAALIPLRFSCGSRCSFALALGSSSIPRTLPRPASVCLEPWSRLQVLPILPARPASFPAIPDCFRTLQPLELHRNPRASNCRVWLLRAALACFKTRRPASSPAPHACLLIAEKGSRFEARAQRSSARTKRSSRRAGLPPAHVCEQQQQPAGAEQPCGCPPAITRST
jgi:hypothetical protein